MTVGGGPLGSYTVCPNSKQAHSLLHPLRTTLELSKSCKLIRNVAPWGQCPILDLIQLIDRQIRGITGGPGRITIFIIRRGIWLNRDTLKYNSRFALSVDLARFERNFLPFHRDSELGNRRWSHPRLGSENFLGFDFIRSGSEVSDCEETPIASPRWP